jgi:alpha-mannosidase
VLLSAWKQSEDGAGTVMRFIELGGARAGVNVESPYLKNGTAAVCNAVEECGRAMPGMNRLGFSIGPRQIYTVKVSPAR